MGRRAASRCSYPKQACVNYVLTPEAETEPEEAVTFYVAHVGLNVARNFLVKFEDKA